jgi:hypothetical protein
VPYPIFPSHTNPLLELLQSDEVEVTCNCLHYHWVEEALCAHEEGIWVLWLILAHLTGSGFKRLGHLIDILLEEFQICWGKFWQLNLGGYWQLLGG